jgi:hypothetical protein
MGSQVYLGIRSSDVLLTVRWWEIAILYYLIQEAGRKHFKPFQHKND